MNGGRQIGFDHAGRSHGRTGADDAERARQAVNGWARRVRETWQEAYGPQASRDVFERHEAEIRYACARWSWWQACERLRRCQATNGGAAPHAP